MLGGHIEGLLVCVGFGVTASALNLSNKFLMKTFDLYASYTVRLTQLLVIQCLIMLVFVETLRLGKFGAPELTFQNLRRLAHLGVIYICHILFGIFAIARLNVPM